jgi:hypothetical protein
LCIDRELFKELRERYFPLFAHNLMFHPVFIDTWPGHELAEPPSLPFREAEYANADPWPLLPDPILDAPALRPLLETSNRLFYGCDSGVR